MFESNEIPDGGRSDQTPKLPSFSSMLLLSKGEYQVIEMGHPYSQRLKNLDTGNSSRTHRPPGQWTDSDVGGVALISVIKIVSALSQGRYFYLPLHFNAWHLEVPQ